MYWTEYTSAHNQWITKTDLEKADKLLSRYKKKIRMQSHNIQHDKYKHYKEDILF